MKILFGFIFLCISIIGVSQEKLHFTHEIDYFLVENTADTIKLKSFLAPEKGALILEMAFKDAPVNSGKLILVYQGSVYEIQKDFSNELKIVLPNFLYETAPNSIIKEGVLKTIKKIDKKDKIAGIDCHYYQMDIEPDSDGSDDILNVCLAENHPINNFGLLFSKEKSTKYNGLLLKIGPSGQSNQFIFKSQKKVDLSVSMDIDAEVLAYNNRIQEIKNDNFQPDYSEMTEPMDAVEKAVDASEAVANAAAAIDIAAAVESEEEVIIPPVGAKNYYPYESFYKDIPTDTLNLAVDLIDKNDSIWDSLPTHCKERKIPELKNKEFQLRLNNYVGQICDMQLYEFEHESVAFYTTLQEIRKEVLFLVNNLQDLSPKDQEKVNSYLQNLD